MKTQRTLVSPDPAEAGKRGKLSLGRLIKEAGEVAEVLRDDSVKRELKQWLGTLKKLALGKRAFQDPEAVGQHFVDDLVPLLPRLPAQLLAIVAATLSAVLDTHIKALFAGSMERMDDKARKEGEVWEACAVRVIGGVSNWLWRSNLSGKELDVLGDAFLPALGDALSEDHCVTLFELQRSILEIICASLPGSACNQRALLEATGNRPAPLTSADLAKLLYRVKHISEPFLDTLDVAAHLRSVLGRDSAEGKTFVDELFGCFRPKIARAAATKMKQGKGSHWEPRTRPELHKILAQESLDVAQPVPVVAISETRNDGRLCHHLRSDEDLWAIGKGLKFIVFDNSKIIIEGDIDGDNTTMIIPFAIITQLETEQEGSEKNVVTTLRVHTDSSICVFKFAIPYVKLFDILLHRPVPCTIPRPQAQTASSHRSSLGDDLQLTNLGGREAFAAVKADEEAQERGFETQERSQATNSRMTEMDHYAHSGSSEVSALGKGSRSPTTSTTARVGASRETVSQPRGATSTRATPARPKDVLGSSYPTRSALASQRDSTGRPRARTAARPSQVQVSVSDLGSDLSEPSDPETPFASAGQAKIEPKRKRRSTTSSSSGSEDEAVDETIIIQSTSPQPPRKKARASFDASDSDEPETWVPPKPKVPRRSYTKKTKPPSEEAPRLPTTTRPAGRSSKAASAAKSSETAADDTWDELPGGTEVAKSTKSRPKPKPRITNKKSSPVAPAYKASAASEELATAPRKKTVTNKARGPSQRRVRPARRAAAQTNKQLADVDFEDIEEDAHSQPTADAEPIPSTIEESSTEDKLPPPPPPPKQSRSRKTANSTRTPASDVDKNGLQAQDGLATSAADRATLSKTATASKRAPQAPVPAAAPPASSDQVMRSAPGSPVPVWEAGSYGGGMDYEPGAPDSIESVGRSADGAMSLSLGIPVVPEVRSPTAATDQPSLSSRQEPVCRSRSRTPALQIHEDHPRLAAASQVSVKPGALRQASILADLDVNARSAHAAPAPQAIAVVRQTKGMAGVKTSETPWKLLASKSSEAREAQARALEERVQQQLQADSLDHLDIFDEEPRPSYERPPSAHLRDVHSTPRVLKVTTCVERSFSEPIAEHGPVAVEPQPASDGVLSAEPLDRRAHASPELQHYRARSSTADAPSLSDTRAPAASQYEVPTARNVRVLSQAEFIPSQAATDQGGSTLASTSIGSSRLTASMDSTSNRIGASLVSLPADEGALDSQTRIATSGGRQPMTPGRQQQQKQAEPAARSLAKQAQPPTRTKRALSPRSAGLSAKDKRHPSQPQRSVSSRAGDPPAARNLKRLLDQLNEELYDKCVRRITTTRHGAHDAGTKYKESLTALHRRFADETMAILQRNDDGDERAVHEFEEIARDLANLREASQVCATEVNNLRDRYEASYAAQEAALSKAVAGLKLSSA